MAQEPEVRERLATEGASALHSTPQILAERARRDSDRWREIIRSLPPM